MNKLYLLTPNKNTGYDCFDGHVICAVSPKVAVMMAKDLAADEGEDAWDVQHCKELLPGKEEIILSSFNAG